MTEKEIQEVCYIVARNTVKVNSHLFQPKKKKANYLKAIRLTPSLWRN